MEEDTVETTATKTEPKETTPPSNRVGTSGVTPLVKTKMEIRDIVELSVRNAREILPKVNDLTLLKYALQEANQLAGKDSLCKIIRKRIKDLQIAR